MQIKLQILRKKLKEKLGKELKKEIENGNYDEIIDYILSAYSEGLNIFYKEGGTIK